VRDWSIDALKSSSIEHRWCRHLGRHDGVAAVGDYYGNGTSDVLLYNGSNGDVGYYAIKNFALDVSPFTNSAWHDIGTTPTTYHVVSWAIARSLTWSGGARQRAPPGIYFAATLRCGNVSSGSNPAVNASQKVMAVVDKMPKSCQCAVPLLTS
jgi:hypothetical protein